MVSSTDQSRLKETMTRGGKGEIVSIHAVQIEEISNGSINEVKIRSPTVTTWGSSENVVKRFHNTHDDKIERRILPAPP